MRKTKLYNLWITIQTSFWFIPLVMILALFCLSIYTSWLDYQLGSRSLLTLGVATADSFMGKYLTVGPDGARAVLTTIAGSMITVAGVTFSITIVALTLAASQFGPRLLRNFMQDKSTQCVLGTFSSTFVYCLLILRSIQANSDSFFVPAISVNVAVLLAIINVGVLIFFIHHISVSLKAENVITSVYDGLNHDIDRIFRDIAVEQSNDSIVAGRVPGTQLNQHHLREMSVSASRSGYLQAVDHENLMALSVQYDMVIELCVRAGDFCVAGLDIALLRSHSGFDEDIQCRIDEAFIYGDQRTPEQDIEYAIHQLVEIAVRSLSKGINDPFTAISCVDYLSALLCHLAQKKMPEAQCYDAEGELRLVLKEITYGALLDSAFNQLRQHSSASIAVTIRMMDAFIRIASSLKSDSQKQDLHRHARMLYEEGTIFLREKQDMADLENRFDECVSKLGMSPPERPV